jgi:hypothetical protein
MKQWFLLTLLFWLLPGTAAQAVLPPSASFMSRPILIPIEVVRSGHIAICAKINGHGPYRFIFDTGAPSLVISEQVARDARILPRDFSRPFFTPLGNLGEYTVRSIELGRAQQPGLQASVWNHPTVEEISKMFGRFEGLIGFPFFARYSVTIDYKSHTIALAPCSFRPEDTEQKMTRKLTDGDVAKLFAPGESLGIAVSKDTRDESAGVTITTVMPHGPAETAGLKQGDRLLTLDGRWTDSVEDCYAALSGVDSSRPVDITFKRDGVPLKTRITVKPAI